MLRATFLIVLLLAPAVAAACDPNENCSRCLVSIFGRCQHRGNDPVCEARKLACQRVPQLVDVPGSPFGPGGIAASGGPAPLKTLRLCAENISRCPSAIVAQLSYEAVRPIVDSYRSGLASQANGRWIYLPGKIKSKINTYYPEIDLDRVRYAENIFTVHGQAITIGYSIYFPYDMDLDQPDDLKLMLHELQHVVQYEKRGGEEPFLAEYIAKSAGKIAERQSFNVHDYIDLEDDANRRSSSVYDVLERSRNAAANNNSPKAPNGMLKHPNPTIQGRTIDACIKSARFAENTGTQCTEDAQRHIASAYCKQAGKDKAANWTSTFTGVFQKSVKYHNDSPAAADGSWVNDDRGGAIFTSITCI